MNLPPSPLDPLALVISQLGAQLRESVTNDAALDQALVTARDIEQRALDSGQPLLAGAAICLQQRILWFTVDPNAVSDIEILAEAWLTHGLQLLCSADDPALEAAWNALQPHLAVPFEDTAAAGEIPSAPADEAGLIEEPAAGLPEDAPVDPDAFLDSLDGPVETPAPSFEIPPVPATPVPAPVTPPAAVFVPPPAPAVPPPPAPSPAKAPETPDEEEVPLEILEAFAQESREAFEAIEHSIMAWERDPTLADEPRNVFRLTHSVKGAANSVGLRSVGTVLHRLEDTLEEIVEGRGTITPSVLSGVVLKVVDSLRLALASGESATSAWDGTATQLIDSIAGLRACIAITSGEGEASPVAPAPEPAESPAEKPAVTAAAPEVVRQPVAAPVESRVFAPQTPQKKVAAKPAASVDRGTIRVEVAQLDSLMNLVGDLLVNRHRLNRKLGQVVSLRSELGRARERLMHVVGDFNTRHEFSLRHRPSTQASNDGFSELELDRYDDFNIVSRQLVEIAADAEEVITQIDRQFGSFSEETMQFATITRELQEQVARTRMVPLEQLFLRLQRAVRDAASSEAKAVAYTADGAENRVDKVIIDQLFTPLLHIVRNAVAHGIESAAERAAAGKPAEGRVHIRSRTEAGRLVLEISDDGGGLRRDAIIAIARKRGLLAPDAQPADAELAELIFQPGFTTTTEATDVSGRGVGLDVVRRDLARLGGSVSVASTAGQGSTFTFTLPLTLVINQVMFVQCASQLYALPINFVERVVEAPAAALARSGSSEMLMYGDHEMIPVIRLQSRLGLAAQGAADTAIILNLADRRTALLVDRIQSKIDIVVKPLGTVLQQHPLFSGATLAGDGRVIFILDVPNLIAPGGASTRGEELVSPIETDDRESMRRVLVVDDSLSIRRIAANYLTQAGW